MSSEIDVLKGMGPPPEDLELLLEAPRVLLAPLDLSEFERFNENPFGRGVRTEASGFDAANEESPNLANSVIDGMADPIRTATRAPWTAVNRATFDLMAMDLRQALSESREFALVSDPELVDYAFVVEVHDIERGKPTWLRGSIVIRTGGSDNAREILRRPLRLTDIATASTLQGELRVLVRQLADDLRKHGRPQGNVTQQQG